MEKKPHFTVTILTADSPTTFYLQNIDHQIETYNQMHIELQAIMRTGTRIQNMMIKIGKNLVSNFFFLQFQMFLVLLAVSSIGVFGRGA